MALLLSQVLPLLHCWHGWLCSCLRFFHFFITWVSIYLCAVHVHGVHVVLRLIHVKILLYVHLVSCLRSSFLRCHHSTIQLSLTHVTSTPMLHHPSLQLQGHSLTYL